MRGLVAGVVLSALLVAAFGGRVLRAVEGGDVAGLTGAPAFEARADKVMRTHGWTPGERIAITADFTYAAVVYRRAGCLPLLVSIVGGGSDSDGLYRRPGGPRWLFMHAGAAYERPPSARYLVDHLVTMITPGAVPPPPLVAVASAGDGPQPAPCDGPSPGDWRAMSGGAAYAGLRTSAE